MVPAVALVVALSCNTGWAGADSITIVTPDSVSPSATPSVGKPDSPTKSAAVAMILSGLVPGAGQVYNESYLKAPIYFGLGAYFAYEFFSNNSKANDYRDLYEQTGDPQYQTARDFYKSERDRFAWYFLILYFINLADAYVDATLYEFNMSDDLSLRLRPGMGATQRASTLLRIELSF